MNKYLGKLTTKRGNYYNIRANKVATGYSKVNADRQRRRTPDNLSDDIDRLSIFGTLDHLARMINPYIKQVQKESLIDKGYFKTVYILTDVGRKRLKTLRRLKAANLPFWEYMYK